MLKQDASMMIKVSVIVPVFNGERHLAECLDSICNQTLDEIEIICVDSGSTDSSIEILEQYQSKDDRITLLRGEGLFAGEARNLGKANAHGEYLAFWDCDDFFDTEALEKLYNQSEKTNADVCVCGGDQFLESKGGLYPQPTYLNIKRVPDTLTFNRNSNPDHYLDFTNAAAWNKLFNRSYIEREKLDFQTIRNGNDVYFTVCALGLADKITVLNETLVHYRVSQKEGLVSSLDISPTTPVQAWIDVSDTLGKYDGFGERTFANKALDSMIYLLSNLQSFDAFSEVLKILQEYGLKKLHIFQQENGYYYDSWQGSCVQHLYEDSACSLALFLSHSRYTQRMEILAELRATKRAKKEEEEKAKEEIKRIRDSWSFKVGKAVMWLPSKLKNFMS